MNRPCKTFFILLCAILLPIMLDAHKYHRAAIDATPSVIPDRIIRTFNGDPATTLTLTWRTSTEVLASEGEFALADASPNFVFRRIKVPAKTEAFQHKRNKAHFHSVTFRGLKPNTLYAYRVGSGKVWSEWFQARTAHAQPAPFTFIYFGDSQNNLLALWSRVIRTSYADAPHADFIIHAGDLIQDPNLDSDWAEWSEAGGFIHAQIPAIPTPGNHEYNDGNRLSQHWRPHFTLPENGPKGLEETVYYVDYQGARIISLNSNDVAKPKDQVPWLENVLQNNPHRWTFVTFHHPIFATREDHDYKSLRKAWKPLFDKYAVDLVLQGHDHSYGRGDNIARGLNVREHDVGTIYVVSVSGPKMYELTDDRWMTRAAVNTQLYQIITVEDDTLHYRAIMATGELYDAFDLIKQDGKPNRLIERIPEGTPERTEDNTLSKPRRKDMKLY
ncbi:MAG: metallophosphoesterase family protein [bacterium]|nr:metallophosphoesterase family protein [bacterium]